MGVEDNQAQEKPIMIQMVGEAGAGRTSLLARFISNTFDEYDPTFYDDQKKTLSINGKDVNLSFIDTGGREDYSYMRMSYMRTATGFVVVYSVSDHLSFEGAEKMYQTIREVKDLADDETVPMVLVGNKCDLEERAVPKEVGMNLAKKMKCSFLEVSALSGWNVHQAFYECATLASTYVPKEHRPKKKEKKCIIM